MKISYSWRWTLTKLANSHEIRSWRLTLTKYRTLTKFIRDGELLRNKKKPSWKYGHESAPCTVMKISYSWRWALTKLANSHEIHSWRWTLTKLANSHEIHSWRWTLTKYYEKTVMKILMKTWLLFSTKIIAQILEIEEHAWANAFSF